MCSDEAVDLSNGTSNLERTSDLLRSPDVEPDSNISGSRQPQPGTTKKRMFSFLNVRNIFQRSSVSYSRLVY